MESLAFTRSVLAVPMFVLFTIVGCVLAILSSYIPTLGWFPKWMAAFWGRGTLWLFGLRIKIRCDFPYKQLTEKGRGKLFLFNHASHMDIPAIFAAFDGKLHFGAKIELFSIPIFGFAMKRAGMLPIARDNRAEVFRVYEEAAVRVARGDNFILAPEGTRQLQEGIGPFKSGPFVFALRSQMDVVPLVLYGTRQVLSKGALIVNSRRLCSDIHVMPLSPISTKGLTMDHLDELKVKVRDSMIRAYEELHTLVKEGSRFEPFSSAK